MTDSQSPGTLRQYESRHRAQTLADNPTVTAAEYDSAYPRGSRVGDWARACEAYVHAGGTLSRYELDALFHAGYPILRIYRGTLSHGIPEGYMPPDVRKWNADAPRLFAHIRR